MFTDREKLWLFCQAYRQKNIEILTIMSSNNQKFNLATLPIDLQFRKEFLERHSLQSIELMRLECVFRGDRGNLSMMREMLGEHWHGMTESLIARDFLEWGNNAKLELTSKSMRIIASVEQPLWKN